MKRKTLWLLPILLMALITFSACEESAEKDQSETPVTSPEKSDDPDYDEKEVLVTVNGDEITQGQFDMYMLQLKNQYESQHGLDLDDPQHSDIVSELLLLGMDQLIEQRALVHRAKALDISAPSGFIDQQIQGVMEQQGSQEAFETFLENRQLTKDTLEILIEEDYLISELYEQELNLDDITYEEEELTALYDRFVEQREDMGREPEPLQEVEEDLVHSLTQRLRHEKKQEYIEKLIDDSEIEYFYN